MVRLAFLGFGNIPRALLSQLHDRPLPISVTGIATGRRGCRVHPPGFSLHQLQHAAHLPLSVLPGHEVADAFEVLDRAQAQIALLCTPLDPQHGQPGLDLASYALSRGIHVITVDKGPIAFGLHALRALAAPRALSLRFEGTVMDGFPLFSLAERTLPGLQITGFTGILNSTTNLALSALDDGRTFTDGLQEAIARGIAEADPRHDLDGLDLAVKVCVLANALLGADLRPADIDRTPLTPPAGEELAQRAQRGEVLRYLAHASLQRGEVVARVGPAWVPRESLFGVTRGADSVLSLQTDRMGEMVFGEKAPGLDQSAYALYADLCFVLDGMGLLPPHGVSATESRPRVG